MYAALLVAATAALAGGCGDRRSPGSAQPPPLAPGQTPYAGEAPLGTDAYRRRCAVDCRNVPRMVLAFYYSCFGTPGGPGGSKGPREWAGEEVQKIDPINCCSSHYPLLGAYDSHDPSVIDRHCGWARQAGVDALVISWWGSGGYEDRAVEKILDGCSRRGLTGCIYYETLPKERTPQAVADEIIGTLRRYGPHPAYLHIDGRPVMFIYARAIDDLGLAAWHRVVELMRERYRGGVVLVGDRFSRSSARVFDGVHTYNPAPYLAGLTSEAARQWAAGSYPDWVDLADRSRRISTLTVIPGYDDTKIRTPGLLVERHGGKLYRALWEEAIRADPHWVLITSFNEWLEGSQIEPSAGYGTQYLDITAEYARRFKANRRAAKRAAEPSPAAPDNEQIDALRRRIDRLKVGVLPGAVSEPIWWLINRLAVEPVMLRWSDVAGGGLKAQNYGILLYAASEHYRRTVSRSGDVEERLRGYLASGGLLAAMSDQPVPFLYDRLGKPSNCGRRLGLPVRIEWDRPPADARLQFVQPRRLLPHVPLKVPFPTADDRRWRPIGQADHARYVSLLELRDATGRSHGDAIAYGELPDGGHVLYAWFRLWDGPHADALLYDLFEFIAEQAGTESVKATGDRGRGKGEGGRRKADGGRGKADGGRGIPLEFRPGPWSFSRDVLRSRFSKSFFQGRH